MAAAHGADLDGIDVDPNEFIPWINVAVSLRE
jgi:hypothetical protein